MPRYARPTDAVHRIVLAPGIRRVFWSETSAQPGDTVTLHVETERVPDGATVALRIEELGGASGGRTILELAETPAITDNRASVDHEIAWDEESLGEDLALEHGAMRFVFVATIADHALSARSGELFVDFGPFGLSI